MISKSHWGIPWSNALKMKINKNSQKTIEIEPICRVGERYGLLIISKKLWNSNDHKRGSLEILSGLFLYRTFNSISPSTVCTVYHF